MSCANRHALHVDREWAWKETRPPDMQYAFNAATQQGHRDTEMFIVPCSTLSYYTSVFSFMSCCSTSPFMFALL